MLIPVELIKKLLNTDKLCARENRYHVFLRSACQSDLDEIIPEDDQEYTIRLHANNLYLRNKYGALTHGSNALLEVDNGGVVALTKEYDIEPDLQSLADSLFQELSLLAESEADVFDQPTFNTVISDVTERRYRYFATWLIKEVKHTANTQQQYNFSRFLQQLDLVSILKSIVDKNQFFVRPRDAVIDTALGGFCYGFQYYDEIEETEKITYFTEKYRTVSPDQLPLFTEEPLC